jgi:hypothetical protein
MEQSARRVGCFILKMKTYCYGILVEFQRTTRCYIAEDRNLYNQRCENIESYSYLFLNYWNKYIVRSAGEDFPLCLFHHTLLTLWVRGTLNNWIIIWIKILEKANLFYSTMPEFRCEN